MVIAYGITSLVKYGSYHAYGIHLPGGWSAWYALRGRALLLRPANYAPVPASAQVQTWVTEPQRQVLCKV